MSRPVIIEVPPAIPSQVSAFDLTEGTVFIHNGGYGVRLFDGAIVFDPMNVAEEVYVYSDEELEKGAALSVVIVRETLRLKIVLEEV